ncbi:uncharacterized protein PV09_06891 [Verruconis gallopava]|uniref:Uncharacterized protein n=1 Tax=Verruconis gallopava TaxID=253628 RepID=A0A0D2AR81_9PEZI|nr:uncharacterized protein PV09_06891 [Verruconis gallopava]KIW01714.1 hypothetical protein PV09_06891 [Verruconis gallopava]
MMSEQRITLKLDKTSGKCDNHSNLEALIDDYSTFLQRLGAAIPQELDADSASNLTTTRRKTVFIMSNQSSSTFQSFSYSSSSFTSSRDGEAPQTWRSSETRSSNPQGTTIHRTSEQPGQLPTEEKLQLDSEGRPILDKTDQRGRIEDVSEADREYLERMEDEYAKREGGA